VQDNGRGFSEVPAKAAGMGLHIMRYRAGMIGGSFAIERGREGGTMVACSVAI
jgi:signal transduction histidine kinase